MYLLQVISTFSIGFHLNVCSDIRNCEWYTLLTYRKLVMRKAPHRRTFLLVQKVGSLLKTSFVLVIMKP